MRGGFIFFRIRTKTWVTISGCLSCRNLYIGSKLGSIGKKQKIYAKGQSSTMTPLISLAAERWWGLFSPLSCRKSSGKALSWISSGSCYSLLPNDFLWQIWKKKKKKKQPPLPFHPQLLVQSCSPSFVFKTILPLATVLNYQQSIYTHSWHQTCTSSADVCEFPPYWSAVFFFYAFSIRPIWSRTQKVCHPSLNGVSVSLWRLLNSSNNHLIAYGNAEDWFRTNTVFL